MKVQQKLILLVKNERVIKVIKMRETIGSSKNGYM